MGEFRRKLQEKVNSKREKAQKELTAEERLLSESRNLQNALVFLEKAALEAKEGWYINSCKELTGRGLAGKLGVFRKKLQRKSLHWYLEPVCDDQSAYNQKIQRALAALEDFAKAQADWNRAMEEQHRAEVEELRKELRALREEKADMEVSGNEG